MNWHRIAVVLSAVFLSAVSAAALSAPAWAQEPPSLDLPVDCRLGHDCFVQQYTDLDPGPAASDFMCGSAVYDGHKGTDIRLLSTADVARGVPVVAAAPGVVAGRRDGVSDRLVRSDQDKRTIAGRECGNGVVLDHGGGWQTQYCHLRRGSVTVGSGARVERGQKLGEVGYSGDAGFAHVHLSVRKDGQVVDPFRGTEGGPDCGLGTEPLWSGTALDALPYEPTRLLGAGLAGGPFELAELETGRLPEFAPARDSDALVVWGWAINLRAGDRMELRLAGPHGDVATSATELDRPKAQYFRFTGKKRPASGWPSGDYAVTVGIERDGVPLRTSRSRFAIP